MALYCVSGPRVSAGVLGAVGIAVVFLVGGGIFFAGGLEAKRKPAYPYRWVDMGFQFTVGVIGLLLGGLAALSFVRAALQALF